MPRGVFSTLTDAQATDAFQSSDTMTACARALRVHYETLKRRWIALFGEEEYHARNQQSRARGALKYTGENHPAFGRTGSASRRWAGEYAKISQGEYVSIRAPSWWKGYVSPQGYAAEHRVVYAWHHAMDVVPPGYDIHHRDGDKRNNRIDNLEMLTRAEHMALHDSLWKGKR